MPRRSRSGPARARQHELLATLAGDLRGVPRDAAVAARREGAAARGARGDRRPGDPHPRPAVPRRVLDLSPRRTCRGGAAASRRRGIAVSGGASPRRRRAARPARPGRIGGAGRHVVRAGPHRGARQAHRLRGRPEPALRRRARVSLCARPARRRRADRGRGPRRARRAPPDGRGRGNGWTAYPAAVVRRLVRNFPGPLAGADIAFASNLPRAAGLSSASALVVAIFTALGRGERSREHPPNQAGEHRPAEDLAGYLAAVENGRPFAALAGDEGAARSGGARTTAMLGCRGKALAATPSAPCGRSGRSPCLPPGPSSSPSSGVAAEKSAAARGPLQQCSRSARPRSSTSGRSSGGAPGLDARKGRPAGLPGAPDRVREVAAPLHPSRGILPASCCSHASISSSRRASACSRRREGLRGRGRRRPRRGSPWRSQESAERLLGNQVPETAVLVASARAFGAFASSAFGAGFGGSVWALAPAGCRRRVPARVGKGLPRAVSRGGSEERVLPHARRAGTRPDVRGLIHRAGTSPSNRQLAR